MDWGSGDMEVKRCNKMNKRVRKKKGRKLEEWVETKELKERCKMQNEKRKKNALHYKSTLLEMVK